MSNDGTGLRELPAKWREEAARIRRLAGKSARRGEAIDQEIRLGHAQDAEAYADELEAALSAVAPPPVLEGVVQTLYAAAGKGFHVSETCGVDSTYQHLSKFQSLPDLQAYEDAWRAIMLAARDKLAASPAAPAQPEGGDAVGADNVVINLARDVRNATLLLEGGELTEVAAANILHQLANDYENAALRRQHEARPAPAQQTVTDEMVMRGARAIYESQGYPMGWDEAESYYRNTAISIARRALTAALASNAAASAADAQEQPR